MAYMNLFLTPAFFYYTNEGIFFCAEMEIKFVLPKQVELRNKFKCKFTSSNDLF